jgi:hypothetical protein
MPLSALPTCVWLCTTDRRDAAQGAPTLTKHDEAHRNMIGRLAKERVAEAERLAGELSEARAVAEQMRRQYCGASSRRKVLEEEVSPHCSHLLAHGLAPVRPSGTRMANAWLSDAEGVTTSASLHCVCLQLSPPLRPCTPTVTQNIPRPTPFSS